ncbi:hypothetical protein [Aliamphritea spongicola]|nr:hypothetical protein [Aliamphritea spongicola]
MPDPCDTPELCRDQPTGPLEAVAGLCPTTEANLGDGIFPAQSFLAEQGRIGIGSDSHVGLSVAEELRLLEYGQRLQAQQRNRLYAPNQPAVGDYLFNACLAGVRRQQVLKVVCVRCPGGLHDA